MPDSLLVMVTVVLIALALGLFYAFAKAGVRNYPYDRPTADPAPPDPFEEPTGHPR